MRITGHTRDDLPREPQRAACAAISLASMRAELPARLARLRAEGVRPHETLNDASTLPNCECLAPGNIEVLYLDSTHELATAGMFCMEGLDTDHYEKEGLWKVLGKIKGGDTGSMAWALQGENWSPHGEAAPVVVAAGVTHTSFSSGDGFRYPDGRILISDGLSFHELPKAGRATAMTVGCEVEEPILEQPLVLTRPPLLENPLDLDFLRTMIREDVISEARDAALAVIQNMEALIAKNNGKGTEVVGQCALPYSEGTYKFECKHQSSAENLQAAVGGFLLQKGDGFLVCSMDIAKKIRTHRQIEILSDHDFSELN